jgi:hypothetical protein
MTKIPNNISLNHNTTGFTWPAIREFLLPTFRQQMAQSYSITQGFKTARKSYLKTDSETIIYYSLQVSNQAYQFVCNVGRPISPQIFSQAIIELNKLLVQQEMQMITKLYQNHHRRLPSAKVIRKIVFISRYEADGPTKMQESHFEDYLAYRLFENVQNAWHSLDDLKTSQGFLYNGMWQLGHFLTENLLTPKKITHPLLISIAELTNQ